MEFNATTRSAQGSSASRRLRRTGRVPAIVYGGKDPALNVELDHNEIFHALRKEQFHSAVLDMKLEGSKHSVLLRAVQWHPYKQIVMHVDFQRVDSTQVLHTKVPLHFTNAEASPAVKLSAAVITHVLTELEIECLPANLPPFIEVDLALVIAGSSVHLADIKLPLGVKYLSHGGDANPVIAIATIPSGKKNEAAAEGTEDKAPEA